MDEMGTGFNGETPIEGLKYEYYISQGRNLLVLMEPQLRGRQKCSAGLEQ